ncbi:uncharacterized protein LOC125051504 isoform X2 [Pieris napi]|uniref:uncharacterized protein LOC125051504 isoform X2 n=1 Tax=Pieris napi TaxID=78633 RepID=UPI001FBBBAB8|nr:uncharacterized protein LOC125051504 isoform X2 [Pieris napi]
MNTTCEDLKKQRDVLLSKLSDLSERIQMLSFSLQQNFIDLYLNFNPIKKLEQLNYTNRKAMIYIEYEKLKQDIAFLDENLDNKAKTEEYQNACKNLGHSIDCLKNFCILVEGKPLLDKANHDMERYNYCEAILSIKSLLSKLLVLKFEGNMDKALKNLIEQSQNHISIYTAHLSVEWEGIFSWTERKSLFFNNCFYLAHSLLGPPWKNALPEPLADALNITLLECIQDLRLIGLEKISLYLQNHRNIIVEKVETNDLPWTLDSYDTFNYAINYSITLMRQLQSYWNSVLPSKMYELSLCTLVQALCQTMLNRIFVDIQPIDEELVYMLVIRFDDTIKDVRTLFEEPKFEGKVEAWKKFCKMPQLLRGQLLEIAELWTTDKQLSETYSCEEIRHIIKIRFPDDKYRLKILKEIQ